MPEQAKAAASKPARRHGVPVWRIGKPDTVLAAAVEVARQQILSIAKPEQLGAHLAVRSEGERVATHLFECTKPGYQGWQWFAVLARAPRAKLVTVSEVGLLPTDDSVLAPEWLPWSERVRPEDAAELAEELVEESAPHNEASETDAGADADAGLVDADQPSDPASADTTSTVPASTVTVQEESLETEQKLVAEGEVTAQLPPKRRRASRASSAVEAETEAAASEKPKRATRGTAKKKVKETETPTES
ncbi:DUF3027 domain-containing protein [Psychromicrobium lacuslunae]|uniref:DUF3027 domain-containing protein n=1 Tax=Psychromicrobium lacuslunae TaxID=1618207 RepID=UPI000B017E07|nr:DUF3027 domain-containing protein [Psychromicrobium lacuslunae]